MVHNKENLLKLGKKMTDRIPQKLGLKPLTEQSPEFWGMVNILDDEMVEIALKMKQRTPYSLAELSRLTGIAEDPLYDKLQRMAEHGLLEAEAAIDGRLDRAKALLDDPRNEKNGYYAFVCEKCAPTFSYYGYFAAASELEQEAKTIYERT